MARVLCIHPWIVDFAAYNTWIEPLGLLTVAAVLREAGYQVALVDCLDRHHPAVAALPTSTSPSSHDAGGRPAYGCGPFLKVGLLKPPLLAHVPRRWGRYGLPVEAFEEELAAQPRPDAVLVTCAMTYWYPGAFETIRRVKARWPEVPVALGGTYATLCTAHARAHSGADAVLPGPGERAALEWVDAVTGGHSTSLHEEHVFPAHDLHRPQGYIAVRTARGCPFACPYCAARLLCPGGWQPRDPLRVVDEIAWCAHELGARDVAFYDDALLVDAEHHIAPLLEAVLARRLAVRFHTPNGLHARYIDRPLARLLRRAGFVTVRLGLESADPAQQAQDGAKVDGDAFARAVEALYGAGFTAREVGAYVLIARPGQQGREVEATVAYAHRLGVPVYPAQFSPIPGTPEGEAALAAGCLPADADPLLHNNSIYPCGNAAAWEALKVRIRAGNRALYA
ncbi:MAG: B12-binding domain-containing radical SAM protein [Anaerolineae bacterium]